MESVEDRLKRIEIENLTFRENIWELTRRVAIVETLVRTHIAYPGNNVPIDTLLGSVPPPQRGSAAIGELCNRLSKLEVFVQNLTHQNPHQNKGPMSNGSPFIFPQMNAMNGGGGCGGSNRIPLPVFTNIPLHPMHFTPGNIPSNSMNSPSISKYSFGESMNNQQSGDNFQKPPGFFTENSNINVLENLFLSGEKSTPITTDMKTHPKTSNKFGQELPVKLPLPATTSPLKPTATPTVGGKGSAEKVKQFTPLLVEPVAQSPSPCTKLCGKLTGHTCGQVHSSNAPCPPCQVLLTDLKLKCGHKCASVQCYIKSSLDFKCSQCENISKHVPQNTSQIPFSVESKNDTVNKKPLIEPTKTAFTPSAIPIDEGSSWMDVEWADEDDTILSTITPTPTTSITNSCKVTENNYITQPMETKSHDQQQQSNKRHDLPTTSSVVKNDVPLSYAQLVTQQQSSSTKPNISPASSISGVSTTSSKMGYNVEETVKRYMKVNSKNKATRKIWIDNEFKKYTNVQIYSFIRHLTRLSVSLSRGTLAGVGQLLNVMIELKITSTELVVQAFLTGIVSDMPKIQKESPNQFELLGENLCYLLVAIFEHEIDLNWLVILGQTLTQTKPAVWGIISTTVLDFMLQRKNEHGVKKLYLQTAMDKSCILSAMKAVNIRV